MPREAFRRIARTRCGRSGLILLGVGVVVASVGGVFLGMLLEGHPSDRSSVVVRMWVFGGSGLAVALFGNYLWYRAAVADRKREGY